MNPLFRIDFSISDSLKIVRKSVLIYETIIVKSGQENLRNYKGTGAVFPAIPDVNFAAYRAATPGIPEVLWRIPADGILLISGIRLS